MRPRRNCASTDCRRSWCFARGIAARVTTVRAVREGFEMAADDGAATAGGRLMTALFVRGELSRARATTLAGLSRSAAGTAIDDLERLGLAESLEPLETARRGRPSPRLRLIPGAAAAIALEVDHDRVRASIVDLDRRIIAATDHPLAVAELAPETALRSIAGILERTIAASSRRIVGVGVSAPGIVSADGIVRSALPIGWHDVPARELLREMLAPELHLSVEHDATLGALGEYRSGASDRHVSRFLYLTAQPRGLGAAMITSPRRALLPGLYGLQAGHLSVDPRGRRCPCGASGCLELYTNGDSIRSTLGLGFEASETEIAERLRDDASSFVESEAMQCLELGLVALVNTLVPDRIVLSQALRPVALAFSERLHAALRRSVVAQSHEITIGAGRLDDSVAIGAAERAFESLLLDPAATVQQLAA
ncbi:ROK family protein [Schumannella soli]|uniref:ROK family protein n=1 Tax=Schumannella soli TaxID=2590779 RepID=A0A506Y1H5_9MICO|nr:ROK family protein [Schumannella soli]TPW74249.1 ROK family protein [Schumannella soli]